MLFPIQLKVTCNSSRSLLCCFLLFAFVYALVFKSTMFTMKTNSCPNTNYAKFNEFYDPFLWSFHCIINKYLSIRAIAKRKFSLYEPSLLLMLPKWSKCKCDAIISVLCNYKSETNTSYFFFLPIKNISVRTSCKLFEWKIDSFDERIIIKNC